MATENGTEISDFEKQRLANIAERDALLKKLKLESQSAGLFGSPKTPKAAPKPKKPTPKRVKTEASSPLPRRQSSRLKGIAAESEVAKRKAEEEYEVAKEAERAKKMRRTDSFTAGDIFVAGQKLDGDSLIGVDVITKGVAEPYVRTFGDEDIKKTADKDLRALREEMNGLKLWEAWDPQSMFLLLMDLNAQSGTNMGRHYRDQDHARACLYHDVSPLRVEAAHFRWGQDGSPRYLRCVAGEARRRRRRRRK